MLDEPVLEEGDDVFGDTVLGGGDGVSDELVVDGLVGGGLGLFPALFLEESFFGGEVEDDEVEEFLELGSVGLVGAEFSDESEELLVLVVDFVILDVEGDVPGERFGDGEGHCFEGF